MRGEWPLVPLGELAQNFDARRVPLSSREREKRRGPYPYYGATGVMDYVDGFLFEGLHLLLAEDGSVETTDGKPLLQLVDGKFWVNNHAHVLKAATDEDTKFLYYALSTVAIRPYMSGSVQAKLSQANMNRILVPYPPDERDRRAIAHILGTLDDKIERNRRMSETLEAMARALFKAWFVDFEPVRAKAAGRDPGLPKPLADLFPDRLVDSERGEIPEGWEVGTLGDYAINFDSKRVPLSGRDRAKRNGPFPYYGAAGIMDYVDDYLFDGIYLLIGEDGSVMNPSGFAVTQYVWGKFWVNNHAHVVQGKYPVSTEQLYGYFTFESVAPYITGAVQPKLSQGQMNSMPFLYAGEKICLEFHKIVEPWFAKFRACAEESRTLAALRDALLPKLISGELRVRDAERFLKERGL
ncbi:MAG: restriction endonuclease [Thermosynechococcus sp.]|uniref:restriction endonuclease subunit S n=1 Tax=Thermosynechococcus sp. TaxID=2814275 RepID=UPI00220C89A8|nr:restriction endonuclease subunit S [Thermosynechococcus sp.]BCX13324.1 MAG: restriction endonuclease [Thermosynechococcus sp.]